jgi:hypothetical protein
MKIKLISFVLLLTALSVYGQSNRVVTLDEAIQNSVTKIQEDLKEGSRIIVYQFQSPNDRISAHVLNQLFVQLTNTKKFTVLSRETAIQEAINKEYDFQYREYAGIISEESLASLTRGIGAQAIVTGSLEDTELEYSFTIKVLGIETRGESLSANIERVNKNDRRIALFTPKPPKTTGEKIGIGAFNMVLGLGSFIIDRDISGGLTIVGGYALSAGLIVLEVTAMDWDNPMVGVPITAGVTVAGITLAWGFIKPFIHNRSSSKTAYILDNTQFGIVPTSNNGNASFGYQFSYSIKF